MGCDIPYIPERLHSNDRENIPVFYVGEWLFRRCPIEKASTPFDGISLVDLSVNRHGHPAGPPLCDREDVLFNPKPNNGKGERLDEHIVDMRIEELTDDGRYDKRAPEDYEELSMHQCRILLVHRKEPCNYAHAAFEIYFDGEATTYDNYKHGLKKCSLLVSWCKTEINKMIVRGEIWLNWPNDSMGTP